jgi:hypothetical protein
MTNAATSHQEPAPAGCLAGPAPGQGEPVSGAVEAREALWSYLLAQGASIRQIARRSRLCCRQVQRGVARARKREEERMQSSQERDSRKRDISQERTDSPIPGAHAGGAAWEDPRRLPRLVPLFPIGPFTPQADCGHHGPLRHGSVFCCMVCSQSGMDGHPGLARDPRTDPKPDPKPAPAPASPAKAGGRETRKQRRRRLYAARRLASLPPSLPPAPQAAAPPTA